MFNVKYITWARYKDNNSMMLLSGLLPGWQGLARVDKPGWQGQEN